MNKLLSILALVLGTSAIAYTPTDKFVQKSGSTMNGVLTLVGPTGAVLLAGQGASRVLTTDSSKKLATSSITDVELGYLAGATSNLQAQISALSGSTTGVTFPIQAPDGSASVPSYNFGGSGQNTGMYRDLSNFLRFSVGGVNPLYMDDKGFKLVNGSNLAPAIGFASETNYLGIFRPTSSQLAISVYPSRWFTFTVDGGNSPEIWATEIGGFLYTKFNMGGTQAHLKFTNRNPEFIFNAQQAFGTIFEIGQNQRATFYADIAGALGIGSPDQMSLMTSLANMPVQIGTVAGTIPVTTATSLELHSNGGRLAMIGATSMILAPSTAQVTALTITLPPSAPAADDVLSSTTAGVTSWAARELPHTHGTATMGGISTFVSVPAIAAGDHVKLTPVVSTPPAVNLGVPYLIGVTAGSGFSMGSTDAADANTIDYEISK